MPVLEAQVLPRGRILRNLTPFFPVMFVISAFAVFVLFLVIVATREFLEWSQPSRPVALASAVGLVLAWRVVSVYALVIRLQRSRLRLDGEKLIVCGSVDGQWLAREYALTDIESVWVGVPRRAVERFLRVAPNLRVEEQATDTPRVRRVRRGLFVIRDRRGQETRFLWFDRAFEEVSYLSLLNGLATRVTTHMVPG